MKQFLKKIIIATLALEARLVLRKYKPKIIAVTGSVGKTSAKDAIFEVLSTGVSARKSEKSYNGELGIPLTILGRRSGWGSPLAWLSVMFEGVALLVLKNYYPKWLVLEVGADRPGDIARIVKWLAPDMVVITRFGEVPVHVEFFGSPEALIEEKSHLVSALKKDGVLITNNDDEAARSMRKKFDGMVITYGLGEDSAVRGSHDKIYYERGTVGGTTFKVEYEGRTIPVKLHGRAGRGHIYAALSAMAVGAHLKLNAISMAQALEGMPRAPGRMRVLEGLKGSQIIDDTYNSSPVALGAALETLKDIKTSGKKIAVLGDMLELGKYTADEHGRIGEIAGGACDLLLVVGLRARSMVQGALLGGMSEKNIIEFDNAQKAGKYLEQELGDGDVVLVKGSQLMRMERAVLEIMAHPERRRELLVRQEKEWLEK